MRWWGSRRSENVLKKPWESRRNEEIEEIEEKKWRGKLMANQWNEEDLDTDCFAWMSEWKTAPSHTVAGIHELYQQLLATKIYSVREIRTSTEQDVRCRVMRQMSRIRCTFVVGVKRTSTDKISSKTQCCAKDPVPEGEEGSELGGSHTPLVFTDTTFWAQPKPMYKSDQVTAYRDVPSLRGNRRM